MTHSPRARRSPLNTLALVLDAPLAVPRYVAASAILWTQLVRIGVAYERQQRTSGR